jgi:hypothetical protein
MWASGSGAAVVITDSGMLMGEVLQSSRRPDGSPGGRVTSLLWALHRGGAVLVLPRHVLEEVERDLPCRARDTDDLDLAYRRLRTLYLARARIVDVPEDWSLGDPRVQAVAQRHPPDLPAAQLAVTIGGCLLLSEDRDLTDTPNLGFAAWLDVAHAAANEVEMNSIYVTASIPLNVAEATIEIVSRRIAAASRSVNIALVLLTAGAVIGAIWCVKTGKTGKLLGRARPVIKEIGRTYGPPLMETFERHAPGQVVFSRAVVPRADGQALGERIARVLAYSSEPLLAGDIARELEIPGNLKDRTRLVRAELESGEAFAEVARGRWVLGRPSGYEPALLSPIEVADYTIRLHKDTRRVWSEESRR